MSNIVLPPPIFAHSLCSRYFASSADGVRHLEFRKIPDSGQRRSMPQPPRDDWSDVGVLVGPFYICRTCRMSSHTTRDAWTVDCDRDDGGGGDDRWVQIR